MTSVLLAFEDRYHSELDRVVRRILQQMGGGAYRKERCGVEGVTNFGPFVQRDWPRYRDLGFPGRDKPRVHRLVCIADADAVAKHITGIPPCPTSAPTAEWVVEAENAFREHVRAHADKNPDDIEVALLRWSYESVVLSGFDVPEAVSRLRGLAEPAEARLAEFLATCHPSPRTVAPGTFCDAFRNPQECLSQMALHAGWAKLKKGDPRKDHAVEVMSDKHLETLLGRVPDLVRIAQVVQRGSN